MDLSEKIDFIKIKYDYFYCKKSSEKKPNNIL